MKKVIFSVISLAILFSGCTHRLGQFTIASSKNIQNLSYDINQSNFVEGEDCTAIIFIFPVGNSDDKIQRAMDNAIENGHKQGLKGNVLVDTRIDSSFFYIPYLFGQNCVKVKGSLVKLKSY